MPLKGVNVMTKIDNNKEKGMKSFETMTLGELMAEDLELWLTKDSKFGFNLTIEDDKGELVLDEKGVHPYAIESFADFCRRYVAFYEKTQEQEAA